MSAAGRRNADEVLLAQLATGATAEEAAKAAGLGVRTVYRRLQDEGFRTRLSDLKAKGLEHAVSLMGQMSGTAVETLSKLLTASSETVRLGAARSIIELGLKLREAVEVEQRLRTLEELARGDGPTPMRRTS